MCEMIKIMQEYGEVTCCLGSSANLRNSCLFLQSDIRWDRISSSSSCLCLHLHLSKFPAVGHSIPVDCAGRVSQLLRPFLAVFVSKRGIGWEWLFKTLDTQRYFHVLHAGLLCPSCHYRCFPLGEIVEVPHGPANWLTLCHKPNYVHYFSVNN